MAIAKRVPQRVVAVDATIQSQSAEKDCARGGGTPVRHMHSLNEKTP